ncbi:acyl-CoA dehydrogenase family protein [Pseudonocardia acidicola]|uniref:Acyl-CoA/acyl-ACP dehydrogenase n=1 Tax=Pseudonocardia acidicola TaxID=2724939 RepID=A0ABX1SID2_9PSEU|nr:acyl-CoA dehydrogenase family protein [Pseudonocardia acidicola]NMI00593.1 acyl-CoA/acyl-ACP dehydrogenase [Pseudonocardia acidicola]
MPSPVEELFAPPPAIAEHPAVRAAARLADDVLAPHAAAADDPARGVDPGHVARLVDAGLLSVKIPRDEGGHGADDRIDAETVELTSGACGATWFVTTQHRTPQGMSRGRLTGLPDEAVIIGLAAERHRAGLATAKTLAGIAVAHLRRPGTPAVRAEPAPGGGWRFTGHADWCTGWGMTDQVMIGATAPDDRYVFVLLPAVDQPGLRAGAAIPLAVMAGTRTVALELDALQIAGDDVLFDVDGPTWRWHDLARTANTTPASLGLLRRVLVELERVGVRRDRPEAVELAGQLAELAAKRRSEAYALLTEVPLGARTAERTALRGEITELAVRSANALIAARSGSAMLLASPEQRWAREASFHLIQAQTAAIRVAQLDAFGAAASSGRPIEGIDTPA